MSADEKPAPVQPEILPPEDEDKYKGLSPALRATFRRVFSDEEKKKQAGEKLTPPEEKTKLPATAKIIQLPLFHHEQAGTPDCFLRSSVFAGTDRGREYVKNAPVKALAGYDLKFTGEQLTQHHLVVWEALVKLANQHPLGNECMFSIHAFLKKYLAYKGKIGKTDYEKICLTFTELSACNIEVQIAEKKVYGGGPISEYLRDDETGHAIIKLAPGLIKLFGKGMWSTLQWEQRLALKKYPLALWLHGFYSSHAKPLPYKVATLQELSGSNIKERYRFRQSLKKALHRLVELEVITGWHIGTGDLVHVEKTPTMSQARALIPALKNKD